MKKTRILAAILVIVLIAASAMFLSCKKDEGESKDENTLGKGATTFKLEIIDDKGETKTFTIKTDEKTVGDALINEDVKLIPADQKGYFTTLNGIDAVWGDETQDWWGFYVNGTMADVSAFDTEIDKDAKYEFKFQTGMGE